jgi:hypothetical protein
LIDAKRPSEWKETNNPADCAERLGFASFTGFVSWDIFDTVLTPGDLILMLTWRDNAMAEQFERSAGVPEVARVRRIRVIRDYGMYDRREAPQYYPDAADGETIHS